MDTLKNALVPILRRLLLRLTNRENGRRQVPSIQLSDLSITERLRKRRKPLEEISEFRHRSQLTGKASPEKSAVPSHHDAASVASHEFCSMGKNLGTNSQTMGRHLGQLSD